MEDRVPPKPHSPKRIPLARYIFFRVAFPAGIVFFTCFLISDSVLKSELRQHVVRVVESREAELLAGRRDAGSVALQSASAIFGEPEWEKSVRQWSELVEAGSAPDTPARRTAETHLLQGLGVVLRATKEDVAAIRSRNGKATLVARREGTPEGELPTGLPNEVGMLARFGSGYFVFQSVGLGGDRKMGWLLTATSWNRRFVPEDASLYLLVENGQVVASAPPGAAGQAAPQCANGATSCQLEWRGKEHLMAGISEGATAGRPQVLVMRPFDALPAPMSRMARPLMLVCAVLNFLGAIATAMLASSAMTGPLREMTQQCAEAEETGTLPKLDISTSRIAEIDTLARTLSRAADSIETGKMHLTQANLQFMGAIVAMLDARDGYTAGHSHRVSAYSEALAREAGLPAQEVEDIRVGALLHDIGKIGVPDEILRKHERLTDEEFLVMKQHPTMGRNILERVGHYEKYLEIVELHHESMDGSGYPHGLRGSQIPIAARIVKVADVYDALSTTRPYRSALPQAEVEAILRRGATTHFDRQLVEIFLERCVPRFPAKQDLLSLHDAVLRAHAGQRDSTARNVNA